MKIYHKMHKIGYEASQRSGYVSLCIFRALNIGVSFQLGNMPSLRNPGTANVYLTSWYKINDK